MDEDQIVEETEAPPVELVDDGMGGKIPAPVQGETDSDPLAGVPDEVRDFMQKSGLKDVGELAKSYQELRREFTRRTQEERRAPEPPPEPPKQTQRAQTQEVDFNALVDAADGDPAIALALYDQHVAGPRLQQMLEEALGNFEQSKIAPLSQVAGSMYWENQAARLRNQHPEEFDRYSGEIEQKFVDDPSLAERPDGMQVAFKLVMGEKALANQARSRASQINAGGRGGGRPAEIDPAQAVRDAIRGASGFGSDRNIG